MSTSRTYGGWAADSSIATGSFANHAGYQGDLCQGMATTANISSGIVRWLGLLAAGAALAGFGTGGAHSVERLQRSIKQFEYQIPAIDVAEVAPVRTSAEDLARIREVLKPAISDLATTFGVSRQSVYNWLNGESVAEENAAKLHDLAQAADVLDHEGVVVSATLLQRKFSNGRSLMQMTQAGESAREAALQLVQIYKREMAQRERMTARFASRAKTSPSGDFDLPAANIEA